MKKIDISIGGKIEFDQIARDLTVKAFMLEVIDKSAVKATEFMRMAKLADRIEAADGKVEIDDQDWATFMTYYNQLNIPVFYRQAIQVFEEIERAKEMS